MGRRGGTPDFQQVMPLTKVVKWLVITNVVIWLFGQVIIEHYFMNEPKLTLYLGLTPIRLIKDYFLWQPFTYLFVHSRDLLHILFNMLLLWWLGSELERHWGSRFFALYYFVSGVGAAFLYCGFILIYSILSSHLDVLLIPVVGASAAVFGLLTAYGLVFGERIVYFMFFFPMKAKYFVGILAALEVVLILNNNHIQDTLANLAHVFGIITGFAFLKIWPYIRGGWGGGSSAGHTKKKPKAGKLRLVVNNEDFNDDDKPRYWN